MSSTSPLRGQALPEISAAFSKDTLWYSKVRALTRTATAMNEGSLLDFALSTTAARVEERCQQLRDAAPGAVEAVNRAHERRSLRVWRDTGRGTLTLSVELPLEAGELICQALDKAAEAPEGWRVTPHSTGVREAAASYGVAL